MTFKNSTGTDKNPIYPIIDQNWGHYLLAGTPGHLRAEKTPVDLLYYQNFIFIATDEAEILKKIRADIICPKIPEDMIDWQSLKTAGLFNFFLHNRWQLRGKFICTQPSPPDQPVFIKLELVGPGDPCYCLIRINPNQTLADFSLAP
ncbi:MAG: hypothetical protein ACKKL5_02115 [Candidatus Komeilibacteria bacterium]